MKANFLNNKEIKNAGWLIGAKVIQMVLSLIVGVLTARFLGPNNYGLINYGTAYVSFFTALCTLGLNNVIIKDFIDNPNQKGQAIGTCLVFRFFASALSIFLIFLISYFVDYGEFLTIVVVSLCSISLIFQIVDIFNYYFQSLYKSKITAIATLAAYIIVSLYKIVLLALNKDVKWFAFATSVDYLVLGVILFLVYKFSNGPKLSFSFSKGKDLLKNSYHYILSNMMVAIYAQTDKIMLKQMLSETEVGFYSVATTICTMWTFILMAIIDSMYPTILNLHDKNKVAFEKKNKQLYALVFYISIFVSLCFQILSPTIIYILYGNSFMPAVDPLRVVTWYTAFSYLGVARNAWIVCEHNQKYLKWMYGGAAFINVMLNFLLIPFFGAVGAALASLITQVFTSIILPFLIPPMRRNSILVIQAIALKGVFVN